MTLSNLRRLRRDDSGAIAPLYAIALFGLVGAAGIGFDYARLAAMDTELQNAADQAALAAVTQLDGTAGAINRATSAAQGGLVSNLTLLANDGDTTNIDVPTLTFYETKPNAEADSSPIDISLANADQLANFVRVRVEQRTANYALTPVVGAIMGDAVGEAVAGLGGAICKTPPLMMCNPDEPLGNTDENYPVYIHAKQGVGLKLLGDGPMAPGNFGYLQTGWGSGANNELMAVGYNTPPGECIGKTTVDTQTGMKTSVMDGFNTRFDIDANGNSCPPPGSGNVNCSPAINVKKDLVRGNQCGHNKANGWGENEATTSDFITAGGVQYGTKAYKPGSASLYPVGTTPEVMGHPRDLCHAFGNTGNCASGRVGTGVWDISAYMRTNHPALVSGGVYQTSNNSAILAAGGGSLPSGQSYPTRYQVYVWETADYATRLSSPRSIPSTGKRAYDKPVAGTCLATSSAPYGLVPGGNTPDRRRISMAVINCEAEGVSGNTPDVMVSKWVDLFLVEPSIDRKKCTETGACTNVDYSEKKDLYVEIIGETQAGGAAGVAGQVVRRDVPYLLQ